MESIGIKAIFDAVTALFAVLSALAWMKAARAPIPFITFPDSSDADAMRAALDSYTGFQVGMKWNKRAAYLTATAALASFLSWLAPLVANLKN